jgi:hypothetical protein
LGPDEWVRCAIAPDILDELSYNCHRALSAYSTVQLSTSPSSPTSLHTFLQSALQNQHNLFDFPADNFDAHMQHYLRCKRKSPHETSACFLVPSVKGPWTKYLAKFKQLKVYPSGTPLYMDSRTSTPIPSPHQVVAYYDQPVPRLHLNAFADDTQHLHMTFPCTIAGQTVDIMVDTGASHSFMDAGFARHCSY